MIRSPLDAWSNAVVRMTQEPRRAPRNGPNFTLVASKDWDAQNGPNILRNLLVVRINPNNNEIFLVVRMSQIDSKIFSCRNVVRYYATRNSNTVQIVIIQEQGMKVKLTDFVSGTASQDPQARSVLTATTLNVLQIHGTHELDML